MVPDSPDDLGERIRQAHRRELEQRPVEHASLSPVTPREINLERSENEGAGEEWDDQPEGAFTGELAGRAPPQRKPAPRPGKQEEEGHPPRVEKRVEDQDHVAAFGVPDLEIRAVEYVAGMKEKDAQRGDYAQPVEIVQAPCIANGALGLLRND